MTPSILIFMKMNAEVLQREKKNKRVQGRKMDSEILQGPIQRRKQENRPGGAKKQVGQNRQVKETREQSGKRLGGAMWEERADRA